MTDPDKLKATDPLREMVLHPGPSIHHLDEWCKVLEREAESRAVVAWWNGNAFVVPKAASFKDIRHKHFWEWL